MSREIPRAPATYTAEQMQRIIAEIDQRLRRLESSASRTKYAVNNLTASRTIDASTATAAEVRAFLATLANDLSTKGVL